MAETEQQEIAEALVADGFNPPPAVGQRWLDAAWRDETGAEQMVEIKYIWKAGDKWMAEVSRSAADGRPIGWPGSEVESLEILISQYRLMDSEED